MSSDIDFWAIIGTNPMRDRADVDSALGQVSQRLQAVATEGLGQFVGILRRCIFMLDRRNFAEIAVELPDGRMFPQTSDHFLYARCACVLAGKVDYEHVLRSNSGFERFTSPRVQSAERLLYLGREAYENRTGKRLVVKSEFAIEWMSNKDGWVGEM